MSTATKLFLVYGTSVLVLGFVLGTILGVVRMKAPEARSLASAHVETLMQGAMHLGLAFAVKAVGFNSDWATWGAVLLVAGSALQAIGATLNWITKTGDQFAEKSAGFKLNSLSTIVIMPGILIIAAGILRHI